MNSTDREKPQPFFPKSFDALPSITAGFSRRQGGVSEAPFDTLNLGLSTGDAADNVRENRRRLFHPLGIDAERLAVAGQVHGNDVRVVSKPDLYVGYDGLVTAEPRLPLCITSADCAVVLMADPAARVVAACHAGWRGAVGDVPGNTVRRMVECGADAARVRAYVSPCISLDHFEVGPDVASRFAPDFVVRRTEWLKPHVDLKAAVAAQLSHAGVAGASIEISDLCTFAETGTFYSYRAEGGRTGRMMGFIYLNP